VRILVVTAVEAERAAIATAVAGTGRSSVEVIVGGVGPACAAAATAFALCAGTDAAAAPDLVLSAGIGGGFAPLAPGEIAVASSIVFADLGAETPEGFVSAAELGFGVDRYGVGPALAVQLAERTRGHLGTVLTVATVTGSTASAEALRSRFPDAVAEGMEGAGVAAAAAGRGRPFAEIRAISNVVGPRDRESWQLAEALAALGSALASIVE
jgi:futalosine hydrolase